MSKILWWWLMSLELCIPYLEKWGAVGPDDLPSDTDTVNSSTLVSPLRRRSTGTTCRTPRQLIGVTFVIVASL